MYIADNAAVDLPTLCLIAVNNDLLHMDVAGAKRKLTQKLNGSLSPQLVQEQTVVYKRLLDRTFMPVFGKVCLFSTSLFPTLAYFWVGLPAARATYILSSRRLLPLIAYHAT